MSKNKKVLALAIIALSASALAVIFFGQTIKSYIQNVPIINSISGTSPKKQMDKIKVGETEIWVEMAETPQEKARGLSGKEKLEKDEGLLFAFENKTQPSFWMKDMNFAIDIIWIADGKIVGIEKNVPAPGEGTLDSELKFYKPEVGIDYVLEVNGGYSEKNSINLGNKVEIPEVSK